MLRLIQIGIGWFTRKANHGYDKLYKSIPVLKSHSYMSVKVIIAMKCEGGSVSRCVVIHCRRVETTVIENKGWRMVF